MTAPTGGDWDTASNWVGGVVPTASNNVIINLTGSGTVTHTTSANDAALSLTTNANTAFSIGSGSITLGNGSSVIGAAVLVGKGAALDVSAGASVQINANQAITDNGALTTGSGTTFTFEISYGTTTSILVNGTMTASGSTFNLGGNNSSTTQIQVNSGGELSATGSTFNLNQLVLESGSILSSTDLTNDTFNLPIYVPAQDIPLLANNQSFQAIEILTGTLSTGQSLGLNLIGTASTANLVYVFTAAFTIQAGATLSVAPKVSVQINANQTITDNGALTTGSGTTFTFEVGYETTTQILVNGTMNASGSTFNLGGNDYSNTQIQVNSGGELTATGTTFNLNQLVLETGSILGATDLTGDTFNNPVFFQGPSPTLSGNETLILGSSTSDALYAEGNNGNKPSTLTIGSGITIEGGSGTIGGYYSGDSVVFDGTLVANIAGGIVTLGGAGSTKTEQSYTALMASNGGTIKLPESLQINGSAIVTVSPSSSLTVAGNLLGTTQNPALFKPQGTVTLNGAGTAAAPELLEAMSADLGSGPTGFLNNFAYGTLILGSSTYVKLVNQSVNSPGSSAEAVYANSLVIPSGSTLNLNGMNLYVRDLQNSGTVTGGSITQIPNSGALALDSPTPGDLSTAGELDHWTFYDLGGDSLTVVLDPGSGAAGGPISPQLEWAQVQLLNSSGQVLATATDSTAGAVLILSNVTLPASATYTIAVSAATGHASSVGNYVVSAYDVTANVQTLNLNQMTTGSVGTAYATDHWTFSASASTQVQFDLLAESASGLNFSLSGPNGFSGFSGITGSSSLVTLPTSGTYTLTVQGTGGSTGNFSFDMVQTAETSLVLDTPFSGTFAGSGQPLLFVVNVPSTAPMILRLADAATADHVELYASLGTAPTRETYQYGANGAGSSQSLLVPSAAAGTWYVLVYAESVANAPSSFTLQVNTTPVVVTAVTPVSYATNAVATLTLNGAGFSTTTSLVLVAANGTTTYPVSSVSFDTFSQLTATVNLAGVPQGVYSIRATNASGGSDTLPAAFTVTAAGQAHLVTQLILPAVIGRHISSTFYIEYSNTGTVAMAAPVILLESSVADDLPLFTLDKSLVVAGYWTSAIPQGYSNTVEILASGKVPGLLEPGESVTVPVYYAGMQMPWNLGESQFKFDLRIFTTSDMDNVDWTSLQSTLQPSGISNAAWGPVYQNLATELVQLGPPVYGEGEELSYNYVQEIIPDKIGTWRGYVQLLDNEATYLGQLGEDITDVNQLWGFAVQQAANDLSPVGPDLASATDDSVAIPGSLSLSFSRVFASSITGRDTMGPLGLGWSTPWQTTATTGSDGTVTITGAGGAQRIFQPDSRTPGVFFSEPGDTGILTTDGHGGYLLTEADGTATDYNSNGTLNYIQDTNANRITAGYKSGRLTSLTASSGQSITIGYNAAGLISSVTDSEGRKTTYTYDSRNQQLISVTGFDGKTTSYTYENLVYAIGIIPPPSPLQNALLSISFPGGTHQYFTYDSEGRLSGTTNDGGSQPQSFAYSLGEVSLTDGTGDTSHLYYNEQGLVVKSIDPLGNVTLNSYDGNFNLASVTNALGQTETYSYNTAGEVTSSTDFLGNRTKFSYSGPFNELSSMTDANGNTTGYSYNSTGDLLTTTYANGTSQSSTYNPEGEATSFLNANGQPIQYTYNASSQILTETFSGGSSYTYTYNSFGAMLTATDATGTTTFSYDPTTELLLKVAYPNNLSLTFTYNAGGQRTSMVDQSGFTVDYTYDSVGRLSKLTDGSGNLIVVYT
jgi:YD repeat-containing protein